MYIRPIHDIYPSDIQDQSSHPVHTITMTHADLLRRFQALKSSSSPSQSTVAPSSTTNPATHADDDDDEVTYSSR